MAEVGSMFVRLGLKSQAFNRGMKESQGRVKKFAGGIASLRNLLVGGAGVYGLVKGIKSVVAAANEQEAAEKRLEAVIRATGNAAGYNIDQMKEMAAQMQQTSTVGDEMILSGMGILATFKNIKEEGFERTTKAALDMSEVMQQDLKSSIVMIGKAMNDPIANLSAMTRAGVQFTDSQKEMIKTLWESGQKAEAQSIILKELESQFGGAAAAAKNTFGGALKSLGNTWGDLTEEVGFAITKNEAMMGLIQNLESWISNLKDGVGSWIEANEVLLTQDIPTYIRNLKQGLQDLLPVVKPIASAFVTVGKAIGSEAVSTE